MSHKEYYLTVTGTKFYYDMIPFKLGQYVILKKDFNNIYDTEAIQVFHPLFGITGYISNSVNTKTLGTMSAGRFYDEFSDECVAVVCFITSSMVIVKALPDKKINEKTGFSVEYTVVEE